MNMLTSSSSSGPEPQWVLSEKAFKDLKSALSSYGSALSPQAHEAIWAVLTNMESGLRGELSPSFYLSSIDPGTGKSLAVAMFLRAYKSAGFLPATGVLVCVSRLAEIETYLDAARLHRGEVAVLTSDGQLNALGAPEGLHDQAPVMFTTQQRLAARGAQASMRDLPAFFYRGEPRALRVWDESILLGAAKVAKVDDLGALLSPLRAAKPQMAAAVQSLMMDAWEAGPTEIVTLPTVLAGSWGKVGSVEVAKTLSALAGHDARLVNVQNDLWLAGAAPTLPADFAPALVLDASGRVRETYRLWEARKDDLKRLPTAHNDYRDMTINVWKRAAGKRTLSEQAARMDIAQAIAEKMNERLGEEWLVVHYKDASKLMDDVRALVGPEVASRAHSLTWGRHHGTNAYAHIPNIVVVGHQNYGPHGYEAVAAAAVGDGKAPELTEEERTALQAGELAHNLLQAVCRSSAREARSGLAGACRVYLCMSAGGGLDAVLDRCFPGHRRREWAPTELKGLTGRNGDVVRYLEKRFAAGPDVVVQKKEVCERFGIRPPALSRCLADERVKEALYALEIDIRHNGFNVRQATFEPYPGGGFSVDDLG
jgi:hypothetical protein